MKTQTRLLIVCFAGMALACSTKKEETTNMKYPVTQKVDSVDIYFGEKVSDPYRWLENDTAKETADWVKAQNDVTFGFLEKIPYRETIKKRLEQVYNYERLGAPSKEGEYYYFYKNDGLQNHSVLYRKKEENGTPEVFLDPNTFSKDGTTGLAGVSFTKDGSMAAYMISEGGSDWRKAIVIKTADKSVVEDSLRDLKFTGIAWKGNEGFYYSSYDKPKGSELSSKTQHHKLFYHKLGTPQHEDILVFGGEATPRRYIGAGLTEDERFLIVSAATSTTGNELYVQDLNDPKGKLVCLVNNFDNNHNVIDNDGSRLIIQTNLNAPNDRIVAVDFSNPTPEHWKDIILETENALQGVSTAGKKLFVNYLKDASTLIKQFDYNGKPEREVSLPGIGTANGFGGRITDKDVYYSYTSFTYPTSIFKFNIASGKSTLYEKPKVDFDPEAYETKQVFYASKDGTKVPMFIVYKKGLEMNGKNPTMLYAYGGFGVSLTPGFNTSRIVWLENGGIYAQPNLRGGGEYGEKWHLAGTKLNKQNVFDDFIAAGEYLIKEKYTSSNYLAISGGSNGGLLVGATMAQRPDLAKVALPAVGVMDMLRYHTFTAGAGWAYDYGTADDSKEMFEYLKKYSPVHALKAGVSYPATMVTTADHDDRVVPSHSFKFAAALQESQSGENPVLIRIDTKSGHGASNLSKAIESTADQYVFAWYNMGVIPPIAKKEM
ncbi:prolyl oligopeptidase family serine peptidase [Ohtaekwangia koreensis]|uniref:prolyl oligopeptidase n=1 Tax=Ohtaekwangia koreensis TaxID=688867 RepID=A0A1T5LCB0_9BACT|nr:prolyl oligopeptidase family serine peptidase [Ohtaekwangia koreensis]SKC73534.1 prolyl oligopeptidase [Ohtaekwangia koreensis]